MKTQEAVEAKEIINIYNQLPKELRAQMHMELMGLVLPRIAASQDEQSE